MVGHCVNTFLLHAECAEMYQAMPEHLRGTWTRIGSVLLESLGPPSAGNPYGKAPRQRGRPRKADATR